MEGNDRGLWITWQLGKSERGRDNQEKEAMRVYLQQQVFRLEGRRPQEGQGAGRIHPHSPGGHSSSSLFVLFFFSFSFTSIQMVFVYCIVFLELLPSTDGVRASSIVPISRRLRQTPFEESVDLPAWSRQTTTQILCYQFTLLSKQSASRGVCRVFSNTPRVRTASLEVTQQHGITKRKMIDCSVSESRSQQTLRVPIVQLQIIYQE